MDYPEFQNHDEPEQASADEDPVVMTIVFTMQRLRDLRLEATIWYYWQLLLVMTSMLAERCLHRLGIEDEQHLTLIILLFVSSAGCTARHLHLAPQDHLGFCMLNMFLFQCLGACYVSGTWISLLEWVLAKMA